MSRASVSLALMVGGVLAGTAAWAASWSEFAAAYPKFPCQDGWMGCIVEGTAVSPELLGGDLPGPSDLRVGWDLNPTPNFSPFVRLSAYSGSAAPAVAAAEEAPAAGADAEAPAAPEAPAAVEPAGEAAPTAQATAPAAPAAPSRPSGTPESAPSAVAKAPSPAATASAGTASSGSVRPGSGAGGSAAGTASAVAPATAAAPAAAALTGSVRPGSAVAPTAVASAPAGAIQVTNAAVASVGDDSCDTLAKLEPQAMLGKLSDGTIACLEKNYASAPKQTDKNKISRVLMANAYSKGDTAAWEKLMKRHLEEVDQSDPDLCYKYAMHLSKGGAGRASGVIKWANAALENRTVWTGDTYQTRVSSLYKLRAAAAQSQWKAAEDENAKSPSDSAKKRVDETRNQTKVLSREWYEYLKAAGKDTTIAMQLCVSAAGTKDYCEGG